MAREQASTGNTRTSQAPAQAPCSSRLTPTERQMS